MGRDDYGVDTRTAKIVILSLLLYCMITACRIFEGSYDKYLLGSLASSIMGSLNTIAFLFQSSLHFLLWNITLDFLL